MAVISDISCVLPRPDIGELQAAIATEFSNRLLGGAPVVPMSTEDVLAFVMAGAANVMHGFVTQALKENDPVTMCCDNLVIYGAQHGINLHAATRAKGYVAITGDAGASISDTIRFVSTIGNEYKLDPGVTFNPKTLDASGAAVLRVVSVVGGAGLDLAAGTILTASTTFPGIDGDATVIAPGLIGGSDNESCDSLRARIVASERAGVISTNQAWYLEQSSRYPGVTRVCADECEGCCDPSHIVLYPFMEGVYGDSLTAPYGVPPGDVLCEMNEWMFGHSAGKGEGLAPVGITGAYYAAIPTKITITAHCFRGCPADAHDRIVAALQTFFRSVYCVGSKICKEQVRAEALKAAGPDQCFSDVTFTTDGSIRREDAAFIVLDCGHFPVLEEVVMNETWK
jgi:hypothetical protein